MSSRLEEVASSVVLAPSPRKSSVNETSACNDCKIDAHNKRQVIADRSFKMWWKKRQWLWLELETNRKKLGNVCCRIYPVLACDAGGRLFPSSPVFLHIIDRPSGAAVNSWALTNESAKECPQSPSQAQIAVFNDLFSNMWQTYQCYVNVPKSNGYADWLNYFTWLNFGGRNYGYSWGSCHFVEG